MTSRPHVRGRSAAVLALTLVLSACAAGDGEDAPAPVATEAETSPAPELQVSVAEPALDPGYAVPPERVVAAVPDSFAARFRVVGFWETAEGRAPSVWRSSEARGPWTRTDFPLPDGYVRVLTLEVLDDVRHVAGSVVAADGGRAAVVWSDGPNGPEVRAVLREPGADVRNVQLGTSQVFLGSVDGDDGRRRPAAWRLGEGGPELLPLPAGLPGRGTLTSGVTSAPEEVVFGYDDDADRPFHLAGPSLGEIAVVPLDGTEAAGARTLNTVARTRDGYLVGGSRSGVSGGQQAVWLSDGAAFVDLTDDLWQDRELVTSAAGRLLASGTDGRGVVVVEGYPWVFDVVDEEGDAYLWYESGEGLAYFSLERVLGLEADQGLWVTNEGSGPTTDIGLPPLAGAAPAPFAAAVLPAGVLTSSGGERGSTRLIRGGVPVGEAVRGSLGVAPAHADLAVGVVLVDESDDVEGVSSRRAAAARVSPEGLLPLELPADARASRAAAVLTMGEEVLVAGHAFDAADASGPRLYLASSTDDGATWAPRPTPPAYPAGHGVSRGCGPTTLLSFDGEGDVSVTFAGAAWATHPLEGTRDEGLACAEVGDDVLVAAGERLLLVSPDGTTREGPLEGAAGPQELLVRDDGTVLLLSGTTEDPDRLDVALVDVEVLAAVGTVEAWRADLTELTTWSLLGATPDGFAVAVHRGTAPSVVQLMVTSS